MDIKSIKTILSAVKHKSLSKAASELSYTPSALSHMADSLEAELGVKILNRSPMGISLTKDGEELYNSLTAVVEAEKALLQAAKALQKEKENHLRIGAFSSISQHLLPKILSQFHALHPEIRVSVAVEDDLADWLENDLADVIFCDEVSHGGNEWQAIEEEPFVAVLPADMLKGKRSVTREELYPYPYIVINEKILDSYFEMSRFQSLLPFNSVDNASVLYMIKQGLGFSVLPRMMTAKRVQGVKALRLEPPVFRTIGAAYKKGAKRSYATQTFLDHLKQGLPTH